MHVCRLFGLIRNDGIVFGALLSFLVCAGASSMAFGHGGDSHDMSPMQMLTTKSGDHDHSKESKFNLNMNMTSSAKFKDDYQHAVRENNEDKPAANDNVFTGTVGYRLTHDLSLNLIAGVSTSTGLLDPSVGPVYALALPWNKWAGFTFAGLAAPLSKSSRAQGRLMSINAGFGVGRSTYKNNFSASVFTSIPTYPGTDTPVKPSEQSELAGPGGVDPNRFNHAEDADHHHHHDASPERFRIGGSTKAGMKVHRVVRWETGYDLTFIDRYFDPISFESEITLSKLSYLGGFWEAGLSILLRDEFATYRFPTLPMGRFNLMMSM